MPVIARRVAKVAERAGEQGGIGVIDIIYDIIVVGSGDHTNSFWWWQRWWRHSIGHGVSFIRRRPSHRGSWCCWQSGWGLE